MEVVEFILNLILWLVVIACFPYCAYQWGKAVIHMFAMTSHFKPGVKKWGKATGYNPFNGLWKRNLLTSVGVEHANNSVLAIAKFAVVLIIPFLLAFIIESTTGIRFFE